VNPAVLCNGQSVGVIHANEQIVVSVPPGPLCVETAGGEGTMGAPTKLEYPEIKAGETMYFHTFVVPGWWAANFCHGLLKDQGKIENFKHKCKKVTNKTVDRAATLSTPK
jgi:hypothetical protein